MTTAIDLFAGDRFRIGRELRGYEMTLGDDPDDADIIIARKIEKTGLISQER